MKNILYFTLLIFCFLNNTFAQDFQWVRQIKGISSDYNDFADGFAIDEFENCYTIGTTKSLLFDLDPTSTGTEIIDNTSINHTFNGTYLIKTNIDGNYEWGLTFGNYYSGDRAIDVKLGSDGNIYALLVLSQINTSLNIIDSFLKIFKISPSGTIISTIDINQSYGFNKIINVDSFDLDNQNNIFLSGYFIGSFSVNNNPLFNLNSTGIDNYLLKIKNNGDFDWIKQLNISDNSSSKVVVRPDGNLNLLINNFSNYVLFDIDNTSSSIIWQKNFTNQTQFTFHVSNNSIVILGDKSYFDIVDVDPSQNIINVSGICKFIIFLNLDGTFLDVQQFFKPNNGNIQFYAITTDLMGNYYFGGNFGDTVDFDSSSNNYNLTSSVYCHEAFYLKLDSNRNFESVLKFGQENPQTDPYHVCYGINIKQIKIVNNNNYLIGDFEYWCDFDPSLSTNYSLNTVNSVTINKDGFILKLAPCNSSIPVGNSIQNFCSAQIPTVNNLIPNSSSIKWYDSMTSTNQLNNSTLLVNGQTYYASQKIGNCPESTQRLAVTITINSSPTAPISANQTFCEGDYATIANLTATGQNLKWYASLTDINTLSLNTILQNNTSYYVTQTNNNCESGRTMVNVIVNSIALPTLSTPQNFCIQQNATLNAVAITGQNIKWYDAQINGNVISNATMLVNGATYFASQTINGCESLRNPVTVNIQNTNAPTGTSPQIFCSTQNATLADVVIAGNTIKWYGSATSPNNLPLSTILVNGTTYYASQTINGCESTNRLPVAISLITNLNANNYFETICDDLNDGFEILNLSNYNTSLLSNTSNCTFDYFNSSLGAENQIQSELISTFLNFNLMLGNKKIYVRITSNNGCFQIVTLELDLVAKPIINIDDIVPICQGSNVSIDAGVGFDTYSWSNGITGQHTVNFNQAGAYSVTVTQNHNGITCSSTKNFSVVNSNLATISEIITTDWDFNSILVQLAQSSLGNYQYSLDGFTYQNSNYFGNLNAGAYTVYVKDFCGITKQDVYLLTYPKFFTPNGDSFNDYWKIKFSIFEPNLQVKIFDRFGKLIDAFSSNSEGWDGNYNGLPMPSSDYWFVVTRQNGKEFRGHFALKR